MKSHKKAINLSISNDLILQARAQNFNLSQILEDTLIELLKVKQSQTWLANNQKAIDSYNTKVEIEGVFSDKLRRF